MVSFLYMHLATSRQAAHETLIIGQNIAKQSELLIRPLLLSDDRVSLNYLLNELNELDYINGLHIQDNNGFTLARAGTSSKQVLQQQLLQQEKTIGTVTIWLNSQPIEQLLRSQLWPLLSIAIFISVLLLTTAAFITRNVRSTPLAPTPEQSDPEPSFSDALEIQSHPASEPKESHAASELKDSLVATEPKGSPITQQSETRAASESSSIPVIIAPESTAPDSSVAEPAVAASISPEPQQFATQADTAKAESQPQNTPLIEELSGEVAPSPAQDLLQTHELVDLLKPAPSTGAQMPKFEHQPQQLDDSPTVAQTVETLVLEEEAVSSPEAHTPNRENPLLKSMADRHEEQLDLYSFEHELELILSPQDAIYLFYIDATTASSENMEPDEKATLLNVYHHLAKQVARIYNGACDQLPNKDILLRFELRDEKDSHGINAVCAGLLFTLLYKGFNQSRIRGFQPVLSLQMSLARGHHNKYDLVKEEAHFLTRTTNSNELISHTALTEAPLLKTAMLKEADIRREDEDKVLLLKVTPKHQTLLQKQANHLLTKIFKKPH